VIAHRLLQAGLLTTFAGVLLLGLDFTVSAIVTVAGLTLTLLGISLKGRR
jgi:hypothetical protein